MFFLGGNFVSSLISTLKSKKPKNVFFKKPRFFPALVSSVNSYPQILLLPTHPHLVSAYFIRLLPVATYAHPLFTRGRYRWTAGDQGRIKAQAN